MVLSPDQMPSKVKQITNSCMCSHEFLSRPDRLELAHAPLSYSRRVMQLFSSIVFILFRAVDNFRYKIAVSHTIATEFIGHDLSGFTAMTSH